MNRVIHRRLKPLIIIWCCLFITVTNCDALEKGSGSQGGVPVANTIESQQPQAPLVSDSTSGQNPSGQQLNETPKNTPAVNPSKSNSATKKNITSTGQSMPGPKIDTTSTTTNTPKTQQNFPSLDNTGALQRGVFVFLGLSVIVIAYIIFRCARLNKNRTQMVRKYGVLAHRQDVEMRPLPLDEEDEDDTTVFDVSEVGVHDKQRRNK